MAGEVRQGVGGHGNCAGQAALPDHRVPEGHPAVAADPVAKGRSRPEAALEIEAQMVASIAQMKMMRASAIPIAGDLSRVSSAPGSGR